MTTIERPAPPTPEPASRDERDSSPLTGLAFVAMSVVLIALFLGILVLGIVAIFQDDDPPTTGGDSGAASALDVSLTEFAIGGELVAPAGRVTLNVVNAGAIDHNVVLRDSGIQSRVLASRGTDTVELGELAPGTYELFCSIPGHEQSGMHAELTVLAEGEAAPEAAGHTAMTPAEMDQAMIDSILEYPAATEGSGNPILEPTILADGTKQFELTAAITPWEVSPGEFVDAWTYNGVVPGPQIKLDVGDRVQVILTNETPMGTDIHWHGVSTPNDQDGVSPLTQDFVATGESFTYEFVADRPAIGMYHAHLHSQTSVVNGMFAAFTVGDNPLPLGQTVSGVEIPEDLDLAFDMPMVINDAGVIGLSLNGKSFPATEPIVMELGQWGAVTYYNEGLTDHPMHLHQFKQLVYAKDGVPLDNPYWADTINVAPGERYSVLFHADAPGVWVWHCHILTHVEREEGMFGMVTAVIVNEPS